MLVLTNMLPTPDRPSFGIFVRDQIEDLRDRGVEVSVHFVNGVERTTNYARGAVELRRMLSRDWFDLVHAHYGVTGAVAVSQRRTPVVTTFHGSDCSGEIAWQKRVSWLVSRLCTPIFVSAHLASGLKRAGAAVIPTATDVELFQPADREEARRSLGWPVEAPTALLLGSRANPVKDPALFDAALDEARRILPALRGVSLEGLSREGVVRAMNAADVTVMTSRAEGSPITIRESIACRTPVVSVAVGDAVQVLTGLPGCAVVDRRAPAIGAAIVEAVGIEGAAELRARAEEFSRPVIAARVVEVYQRVLDQR